MLKQIFGFPVYIENINPNSYDKKKIIKDIEFNYKKDKHRDKWAEHFNNFNKSNLHHSYDDHDNLNFKSINYDKLIPIYSKVFEKFFNNLHLSKSFKFKFNIVNYTCMTSNQFMKGHYHPEADFTAVHYIKFDKTIHKPTFFENSNTFSSYSYSLQPLLKNVLDQKSINNSWFFENYWLDINENDICITPALLFHSVPNQPKTDSTRITIVSNIMVE